MTFIIALLGGGLYRWRGHASKYKKYFPRPFNQIAFALPYAYITYYTYNTYFSFNWCVALIVLGVTTAGVLTGHGNYFNNDRYGDKPERTEFLILWFKQHIPLKLYKFVGMAITGLCITLPAGIVTMNVFLALSGTFKAVAYFMTRDTRVGEFFTGFFLWGILAFLCL